MASSKQDQQIQSVIEKFLEALAIEGTVTITPESESRARVHIEVSDGSQGYIIGKQGATLLALQHLISLIVRKADSGFQYRIDSNDYQQERDDLFLKRVDEYVAEKQESTELLLWPMTPYERRLVHEHFLTLGTHTTESEDFGSRRVVRVIKK